MRLDKRKELFINLTKEFDSAKELVPAKKILDTWAIAYAKDKGLRAAVKGQFSIINIDWILSKGFNHRKALEENYDFKGLDEGDLDDAWLQLRDSFDALFDFFEKLVYFQKNNRITNKEMAYFEYYLELAKNEPKIITFLDTYDFTWHKVLKYEITSKKKKSESD